MAKKQESKKEKSEKKSADAPKVPRRIYGQASPRSIGGVSMFDAGDQINAETVANFTSQEEVIARAVSMLQEAGFDVLQVTESTINIAGTQKTFDEAFDTEIFAEDRPTIKEGPEETTATFLETRGTEMPGLISTRGTAFESVLEGVALEVPRYFMAASMYPPPVAYWHLDVPGDVSLGCNADKVHRSGTTGKGVNVAMVDSGHFKHPFFVGRGYRVQPVVLGPAASNPLKDESGHGTGESANIFAVAPDVTLLPVKISFVNSIGAFNAAVGLGPDIITCSWGSSRETGLTAADQVLATAVATAVASGIIVIFSAGNGHWGFPGQHPDVISAGGVFMDQNGALSASNYSSGFMSNIYPNRRVPDLSGLVGELPKAIYIMLPLEPNDGIDQGNAGGNHPNGDETANNDGWAAFSGTSAAAPQLAGAAALVKQACPNLTPSQVRDILMKSARDVTQGNCNPNTGGNAAVAGPDTATGNGLVDAHKAVLLAKIRCRTVSIQPIVPIQPIQPISPVRPISPIVPIQPITPIQPVRPIGPVVTRGMSEQQTREVTQATQPQQPAHPQPQHSQQPQAGGLTEEDAKALEDMVIRSEIDEEDLGEL